MHDILLLKGDFDKRSNQTGDGFPKPSIKKNYKETAGRVSELADALQKVCEYWSQHKELNGALVNVIYKRVIPKSSRISQLFLKKSIASIRGSKFKWEGREGGGEEIKHVFTHFLPLKVVEKAAADLRATSKVLKSSFGSAIESDTFGGITKENYPKNAPVSRTRFQWVINDIEEVENFRVASPDSLQTLESLVTIYDVGIETKDLLGKYGITITDDRIINGTTVKLSGQEVKRLQDKAPYLIAMSVNNLRDLANDYDDDGTAHEDEPRLIPPPTKEPIIGVIDTAFDTKRAYFREWVDYHEMIPGEMVKPEDLKHGTAVSSIIVDGPRGNPDLQDDCGHFRVRHFGVLVGGRIDTFDFMQKVQEIVSTNLDIKVWNISVGSEMEINPNFISPEGALLDYLQRVYDIIFVVAGTNIPKGRNLESMRIGSPADSLNSMVVNAVNWQKEPASYTREGPVLSFFIKPDVCYYGGESARDQRMIVNDGGAFASGTYGTSVAAPWIARKLAYLIHVMGLSREIAKALVIDSALGWNIRKNQEKMGYGLVPTSIKHILSTENHEIRFVIRGETLAYETYTTTLPVPATAKGHPFLARATMVYFPWCERNHGVDYTNTEMMLKFGRVRPGERPENDEIDSLDEDRQGEQAAKKNSELEARKIYRKWDNVKRVADSIKRVASTEAGRAKELKALNAKNHWGISITTKSRGTQRDGIGLPFGIVITLREIRGQDRMDEFIQGCRFRSWIVNRLNPDIYLQNYLDAHEEIELK